MAMEFKTENTKQCWELVQEDGDGNIDEFIRHADGANLRYEDGQNRNMLMFAAQNYKWEIFELLLKHTELAMAKDSQEGNIFHYIAVSKKDDPMMARRVVEYIGRSNAKNMLYEKSNGKTPFIYAENSQNQKLFEEMKRIQKDWKYRFQHRKRSNNKINHQAQNDKARRDPPTKRRQPPPPPPCRIAPVIIPQKQNKCDRASVEGNSIQGETEGSVHEDPINEPLTPESSSYESSDTPPPPLTINMDIELEEAEKASIKTLAPKDSNESKCERCFRGRDICCDKIDFHDWLNKKGYECFKGIGPKYLDQIRSDGYDTFNLFDGICNENKKESILDLMDEFNNVSMGKALRIWKLWNQLKTE